VYIPFHINLLIFKSEARNPRLPKNLFGGQAKFETISKSKFQITETRFEFLSFGIRICFACLPQAGISTFEFRILH